MRDDELEEDWDEDDEDQGWAEYDEAATVECPSCGEEIYEDAQRCPHCGSYVSQEDAPLRKPLWIVLGTAVCLYVVYRWIVG